MNLLAGLEKFGLDISKGKNLYEDEAPKKDKKKAEEPKKEERIPTEEDFLLDKKVRCKVCDKEFKIRVVKNGRVRRMEPDPDLRPRFQFIDTLKYDVTSCPFCGYTAMNRYFDQIGSAQIKLIKEEISSKFKPTMPREEVTYSYDRAIDRYKLSLMNTIIKRGKISERAYTCLKISWLMRDVLKGMSENTEIEKKVKEDYAKATEQYYQQAYEGFVMACSKEMFPICGMEQSTLDYLLAYMSYHFGKYELASKYLASVMSSQGASRKMKDMALDLKDQIVKELRASRQQQG